MVKGCKVPKCKTTCDKKTTPKKKKPAPKFAMAGNGKANCGKLAAVTTEKACRASAKVIKKPFGSSGAFGSYPKGCFVYNNKLYFNNGKTGKANSKSNPVCVAKATGGKKTTPKKKPVCKCPKNVAPVCGKNGRSYGNACMAKCAKTTVVAKGLCKKKKKTTPKKPATKLVLAGKGKANCAGKGAAVKSENGCKAAAKAMKKAFSGSGAYASYPKGCFLLNNQFYYNKGKTGKANSKARPVCVSGATGGKKTTPKKKPANPCAKNNG